jgi:xylulokinase
MYFMGIDIGTSGARVVICDESGDLISSARASFAEKVRNLPEGWSEQSPRSWISALENAIPEALEGLKREGRDPKDISAISATSTSGTFLLLGQDNEPISNAIMYNDSRAQRETDIVNELGSALAEKLGYRFNPSFALPKLLWLKENMPELMEKARILVHATDYIIGWLTGVWGITDYTNALKTGFDLLDLKWPDFLEKELGIRSSLLPKVVPPGTVIGRIRGDLADLFGISKRAEILSGMTDGCASQVASGAIRPGDWNSTLGTTLVLKGVSRKLLIDPSGRIYSHRHPEGYWLPGGASNTGGEYISQVFGEDRIGEISEKIRNFSPSKIIIYPLRRKGERFPFVCKDASGFIIGEPSCEEEHLAAAIEGIGYVERLGFEVLAEIGAEVGDRIYVSGGGTREIDWLRVRADILGKVLARPKFPEAAVGSAIIASISQNKSLSSAAASMVKIDLEVEPKDENKEIYDENYRRFVEECRKRGYIGSSELAR